MLIQQQNMWLSSGTLQIRPCSGLWGGRACAQAPRTAAEQPRNSWRREPKRPRTELGDGGEAHREREREREPDGEREREPEGERERERLRERESLGLRDRLRERE